MVYEEVGVRGQNLPILSGYVDLSYIVQPHNLYAMLLVLCRTKGPVHWVEPIFPSTVSLRFSSGLCACTLNAYYGRYMYGMDLHDRKVEGVYMIHKCSKSPSVDDLVRRFTQVAENQ
ncbi:hypothetical protein KP509_14G076600 [Ceratopteris richardii]|uniref:Uncharacterized protein n=1 Tax=Ceratopteris richardii TaxID=49495 RepID=A0A8T2TD89_CERRI|nr:hypothetical protein KP509_14G076600 [Ceratopteris richardii]